MNEQIMALLWTASFRYYCGRMTAGTHSFCDALLAHWESIPVEARVSIREELRRSIDADEASRRNQNTEFHPLGHSVDRAAWLTVNLAIKDEA